MVATVAVFASFEVWIFDCRRSNGERREITQAIAGEHPRPVAVGKVIRPVGSLCLVSGAERNLKRTLANGRRQSVATYMTTTVIQSSSQHHHQSLFDLHRSTLLFSFSVFSSVFP